MPISEANKNATDVLFYVQSDGIGDTLAATPVIRYFCKQFGDRKVDVWTARPEVFANNPYVAKIHTQPNVDVEFLSQWHRLNIKQTFIRSDKPEGKVRHYHTPLVDYCSVTALSCIIPSHEKHFEFVITPEDRATAKAMLRMAGFNRTVVMHPSDTWKTRRMPKETWEELCKLLLQIGITPVIVGKRIVDRDPIRLDTISGVLDLVDKTSLGETIALMDESQAVVTLDAGSICMAGCTDTPIVGVFTVNPPEFRAPYRNGTYMHKLIVANRMPKCIYCGPQLSRLDNNLSNCLHSAVGNKDLVMSCLPSAKELFVAVRRAIEGRYGNQ
jgi:ADP-heptose:LPS heptosyltransferase